MKQKNKTNGHIPYIYYFITAIFFISACPFPVKAQLMSDLPEKTTNKSPRILAVEVRGNKLTEKAAILKVIESSAGELLNSAKVASDIRAIWNLKKFRHVQVEKINRKNGIILIYRVQEKPFIKSIIVHGVHKLELETINKVITIKPGTILDEAKVKDNAVKIKQRYLEDGFYLANVKMKLKTDKKGRIIIHYYINEGPQVKVGGVSFSGNTRFSSKKLRSIIATRPPGPFAFLSSTSGVFKESDLKMDLMRISSLYLDNGYVKVKVGPPEIEFSASQKKIYIHIPIEEGNVFTIKSIDVSGTLIGPDKLMKKVRSGDKKAIRKLKQIHLALLKTKPGDLYNRTKLVKDLKRLVTYYRDRGYAYANVIPIAPIDMRNRTISVNYKINPGKKVYIERIEFYGNNTTRDKVLRREMRISEGDLYSSTKINISRMLIMRLGYFKSVKIKTEKGSSDDKILIKIYITENSTGTFNIGAGFSTVENFMAQAQITQQNLFGRGQTLMLMGQLSSLRQYFSLRFIEPHFLDTNWYFAFSLYNSVYAFESFNRNTTGGSLTWGYAITPFWRILLTYKLENIDIDTSSNGILLGSGSRSVIPSSVYVANLFKDGITSSFRASLSWDKRNNRRFPTKGFLNNVSVEVARPEFGSQNVFNRYRAFSRFYYPVLKYFTFKMNSEIGLITSPLDSGIPIFERFFLGGINTVRGFKPYSLGPKVQVPISPDPSAPMFSFRKGGDKSLFFNWELEFDIFKAMMLKGVMFVDAGNAFDDDENYSLTKLRSSWGFGIRWYTFMGILRFEWGIPIDPQPGEDKIVFEFNIGNSF